MNRRLSRLFSLLGVGLAVGWCLAVLAGPAEVPVSAPAASSDVATGGVQTVEAAVPVTSPELKAAPEAEQPTATAETIPPAAVPETVATERVPVGTNAASSAEVEVMPVVGYAPQGNRSLISVSLDDVPLQDVVRLFTRISGANIIATPSNLQGKVTVSLQDVEWKPALGSILDMYSMMISEKIPGSGIYSVQPKLTEPLIADAIALSYASVSNVAAIVSPMVGKDGSVASFPNANTLVVRANAANLNDVRKVIQGIDVPRKQVFIEAKFLELSDDAIKDLGISWQVLEGYGVGVNSMQWSLNDTRTKTKNRSDKLSEADKRTRTDSVDTRIDKNGNQYADSSAEPAHVISDSIDQSRSITRDLEDSFSRELTDVRTAVLSADDFGIVLSALKQMNGVSIVSNPKIIVANEETATIHIGENEPNIKGTVTPGQQGQANTTTYTLDELKPYFEFGISLDVTPTINNDSNITIRINPTLSRFVKDKVAPDNNTFPVEATKTIKTVFSLESGKTAAIGGLTETDNRDVTSKIPLLGDIPLLGKWLFSHTHKEQSQTETIIFVTVGLAYPHTIQTDEGLPEEALLTQKHLASKRAAKAGEAATSNANDSAVTPVVGSNETSSAVSEPR